MFWEVVCLFSSTFSYLTECISEVLWDCKLPESLKLSDIVPVYKKKTPQINRIFDQLTFSFYFKGVWQRYIWSTMQLYEQFSEQLTLRILHNMSYLDYSRPGKKSLINVGLLALYLWIYLKRMTAHLMIYWSLS